MEGISITGLTANSFGLDTKLLGVPMSSPIRFYEPGLRHVRDLGALQPLSIRSKPRGSSKLYFGLGFKVVGQPTGKMEKARTLTGTCVIRMTARTREKAINLFISQE